MKVAVAVDLAQYDYPWKRSIRKIICEDLGMTYVLLGLVFYIAIILTICLIRLSAIEREQRSQVVGHLGLLFDSLKDVPRKQDNLYQLVSEIRKQVGGALDNAAEQRFKESLR